MTLGKILLTWMYRKLERLDVGVVDEEAEFDIEHGCIVCCVCVCVTIAGKLLSKYKTMDGLY